MPRTILCPEILAQRLEHVADYYDKRALQATNICQEQLRRAYEHQARESRVWAHALRTMRRVIDQGADDIVIDHY